MQSLPPLTAFVHTTPFANRLSSAIHELNAPPGSFRVGVLNNPYSGKNTRGLDGIRSVLREFPQVAHRDVRTPRDVASAVEDYARDGVEILAINGGDGTVQAALTALFKQPPFDPLPMLAVLTAGTTSMIASDVGIRGAKERALTRLLIWANNRNGTPTILRRPVLRMDIASKDEPVFGMFFGTGAIIQGIEFCRQRIHSLGVQGGFGAGLALALLLMSLMKPQNRYLTPTSIAVNFANAPPETQDCLVLFITALEHLFLGLRPHWGTENAAFHYTVLRPRPKRVWRVLPAALRGYQTPYATAENGYISHNVDEVHLELSCGFTLDGELYLPNNGLERVSLRNAGHISFLRV